MLGPASQEKRRTSQIERECNIAGNHFVSRRIGGQRTVNILDRRLSETWRHPKIRVARNNPVFEWIRFRHYLGAQAESNWATLHVNDGMVSVFSGWRRS